MKNTIKTLGALFVFMGLISNINLHAQCSDYYPMTKGTVYEITHYDKKGQKESVTRNEVTSASGNTAVIHTTQTTNGGEEKINASYDIKCTGDGIAIDMNKLMKEQMSESMKDKDITVDITGTDVFTPNNLKVGQTLPDNEMNMVIKASTMTIDGHVKTYERKVVGKEKVTVPAGTFDCMVIESRSDIKLMISKKSKTKMWIAKGVGIVKQETYNKKGKLQSSEKLTLFKK